MLWKPIAVNVPGRETVVRFAQFANALCSIVTTPSGMIRLLTAQPVKAHVPICFNVVGNDMFLSAEQPLKAPCSIT